MRNLSSSLPEHVRQANGLANIANRLPPPVWLANHLAPQLWTPGGLCNATELGTAGLIFLPTAKRYHKYAKAKMVFACDHSFEHCHLTSTSLAAVLL